MERLKSIKETLVAQVQNQMGNLECVDAKELGEVVDMIKDIEEAIYYCTITKAMDAKDWEEEKRSYMTVYPPEPYYYRDIDRNDGRMYYTEHGKNNKYTWEEDDTAKARQMYMQSKDIKSLEKYMHELTDDVMELVHEATPEEK